MNTFLNVMEVLVWAIFGLSLVTSGLMVYAKIWDRDGDGVERRVGPADRRVAVPRP
jgi:hypothetical protein